MRRLKKIIRKREVSSIDNNVVHQINIEKIDLPRNPRWTNEMLWGFRSERYIDKIIVHQALSEGDTIAIHNYHTSENSHLKKGGAPKIAYHFTIEKSGKIYQVNEITDVTWHCIGQNIKSIGILVLGNFDGPTHTGKSTPTQEQLESLEGLVRKLQSDLNIEDKYIYGHCDFGKENCPGNELMRFINSRWRK